MDEISVKIKEAAYKEFLEKGFEKASMRNIAKTAGITTGAFYSRFENKDALYKTVFEDVTTKLERLLFLVSGMMQMLFVRGWLQLRTIMGYMAT